MVLRRQQGRKPRGWRLNDSLNRAVREAPRLPEYACYDHGKCSEPTVTNAQKDLIPVDFTKVVE